MVGWLMEVWGGCQKGDVGWWVGGLIDAVGVAGW